MSLVLDGIGLSNKPGAHISDMVMTLARRGPHALLGPALAGKTISRTLRHGLGAHALFVQHPARRLARDQGAIMTRIHRWDVKSKLGPLMNEEALAE